VLVGTGPQSVDSNIGESFSKSASIYVFKLDDGSLYKTVNVNVSGAAVAIGDIMPVDVNNDYTDDVAYFGVYGVRSSIGAVYGALYRLNLSNWSVSQAFDFGSNPAPVFGAPNYTLDENGNFWVFFGTGKYLSNADKNISYTNYLVGYKDPNWSGSGSTTLSALTDVTGQTTAITPTSYSQMCICDSTSGCGLKNVVTDASGNIPPEAGVGWYIKLTNEVVYSQPMVFGGVVNALSTVLPQDMCAMEGSSKLYSLYFKSGTPYPRPTILSPYSVVGGQVQQSVSIGRGVSPFGQPFQITAGSGKEFQAFLQVSTGVILKVPQQVASPYEGRFILAIEK
jgi:type IV pilus assembly protein PilY1